MPINRLMLIALMILTSQSAFSQSAKDYFKLIDKAEKAIINQQLDSSLYYYNQAFQLGNFPFAREMYQATVIASFLPEKDQFYSLLEKCLLRGMNKRELLFFAQRLSGETTYQSYVSNYNSYHKRYLESIDTAAYKAYMRVSLLDQSYYQEYNMLKDRDRHDSILHHEKSKQLYMNLVAKHGWPTENKVGLGNHTPLAYIAKKEVDEFEAESGSAILMQFYSPVLTKSGKLNVYGISSPDKSDFPNQSHRCGAYFLWHYLEERDTTFIQFIDEGVQQLNIHPHFFCTIT